MGTQSFKTTYYSDENFNLEYEEYEDVRFIHSHVENWKLSVFKQALSVLNTFLAECKEAGVKAVLTVSPNPRWCELFGGYYVNDIRVDGKEYGVYKWELN